MSRFVALTAVLFSLLLALPVQAEGPPQAMDPAAQAEARAQLKKLAEVLGVELPKDQKAQTAQANTAEPQEKKTIADIVDKALDMTKGLVSSISQNLEKVAPQVWRVMIRQQYAKAIGDVVLPWLLFVMVLIYTAIVRKKFVKEDDESDDRKTARVVVTFVAPVVFAVAFFVWGAIAIADSIKYLVNPEYYAIRDLLVMLLSPGHGAQ